MQATRYATGGVIGLCRPRMKRAKKSQQAPLKDYAPGAVQIGGVDGRWLSIEALLAADTAEIDAIQDHAQRRRINFEPSR